MSNIWVFGDSYSTYNCERQTKSRDTEGCLSIYSELEKYLGYSQNNFAISGISNEQIFSNLLSKLYKFKKGDLVFLQLSFLDRVGYIKETSQKKFNERELELISIGKRFYQHPQYYYENDTSLTDFQKESVLDFLKSNQLNLLNFYFKFFTNLKSIDKFFEENDILFKLILLEDQKMDWNGERISLLSLVKDLNFDTSVFKISDKFFIKSQEYYREENSDYDYHHFSIETIQRYGEELKKSFVNEFKI